MSLISDHVDKLIEFTYSLLSTLHLLDTHSVNTMNYLTMEVAFLDDVTVHKANSSDTST